MAENSDPGRNERVSWPSHGREVTGRVKKKITKRTEAAGRKADASQERPQYEVESEKSGACAVHRPEPLRRKGGE